jgi:hypothetical protein
LTALVALAMTATMTFLPGTVQVVQAKEKELPAAAQKVETPAPSPTEAPEVVATAPAEEANAPAPEPVPDAATPTVEAVPAAESVAETPVIVEPTVVEADVATEGARAPPVETKTDAAGAALEPAGEILPAGTEGGIAPMNGSGQSDVAYNTPCVAQQVSGGLNCTANDVQLAQATNLTILDDGCAFPGDTVTFSADFQVNLTAQARYDLGIWFASDGDPNGDGALTGTCAAATPPYAPDPPWLDLDQAIPAQVNDTCGDINGTHNPLYPNVTLTVSCVAGANGKLNLPYVTSWRQPGDNSLCTSPTQAVPGAPSKCYVNSGYTVDIPVPGQIIVDKVTAPGSYPTLFDFTVTGTPTDGSPITPETFSLTDTSDPWESANLYGGTYSVEEAANASYSTSAQCVSDSRTETIDPASIDLMPGEIVTCTFTNTLRTGTLQLVKRVVNDNGGTLGVTPFGIETTAGALTFGDGVADGANTLKYSSQVMTVQAGSYSFSESDVGGYSEGTWSCTGATAMGDGLQRGLGDGSCRRERGLHDHE